MTGGVHGYETSGVQGALRFADLHAAGYAERVNLLIAPCVSPWAYEVIHRWNLHAIDPNRSFRESSPSEEAAALMRLVAPLSDRLLVHVDLHETTDTDESEFRPALAARDGTEYVPDEPGVIRYPLRQLGLCAGMTSAAFKTTTEVYPDSPRATPR